MLRQYSARRKYLLKFEIFYIDTFFILFKVNVTFKIYNGFFAETMWYF